MTYRTRSFLFYVLLAVFLVGGAGVVFYSQGWRVDLHTFALKKVGALYVRTFPKDAALTLDGKPVENKSWLLRDGTLIDSLFPKTYTLDIVAPGFESRHETLSVKTGTVTERKYAVLVPTEAVPLAGTSSTAAMWLLPDTTVVRKTTGSKLVMPEGELPGVEVAAWSENARYVLTRTSANDYVRTDRRNSATTTITRTPTSRTSLHTASFWVTNDGEVVAETTSTLAVLNPVALPDGLIASYPATVRIGEVALDPDTKTIAWTTEDTTTGAARLAISTLSLPIREVHVEVPAPIVQLSWIDGTHVALLDARGSLAVYDTNRNQTVEIAHSIRGLFAWSPANDAVAVRGDGYIEVIPLVNEREGITIPMKDEGRIQHLVWYHDLHHLLAIYPDRTDIIETDQGAEQTIRTVIDAGDTDVAYDFESNILYGLKGAQLDTIPFPNR